MKIEKIDINGKKQSIDVADKIFASKINKELVSRVLYKSNVNLISFKKNNIEISFNENLDKNFIKNITSKLFDWTGERWIILLSKKSGLKSIKEIKIEKKDNEFKNLKNSKFYKKATNLFPDLEIVDIKDLNMRDDD